MPKIQMVDLKSQYQKIKNEVDAAIQNVIDSCAFINGPEVKEFQKELEQYLGVKQVIPCANGTDALQIAMMALDLEPGDEVTLSSLHSSKGLEWPVVFLIGLNEGTLPHLRTIDPKASEAAPTDVEEERRLFYVGVTRARERLYLSRFLRKELRGSEKPMTPSRFLEGLPEDDVEKYERDDDAPASQEDSAAFAKAFLAKLRGEA